jgi:hypothetical protein
MNHEFTFSLSSNPVFYVVLVTFYSQSLDQSKGSQKHSRDYSREIMGEDPDPENIRKKVLV